MHEWWEPDTLTVLLAALRRLRRGQRVYIVIGSRITLLILTLAVLAACGAADPAAPAFATPDQLVQAIQAAQLEAASPAPMTKDDYGLAPLVGSGVRFLIPSLCPDCGGRAFVGSVEEIQQISAYYNILSQASAAFFSWVFISPDGRAMIQINGDLPEEQANRYSAVLDSTR